VFELFYLAEVVVLPDGLPLGFLLLQLETVNHLLQPLPLLLLLCEFRIGGLQFLQHLVKAFLHFILPFVELAQLLLQIVVLQLQLLGLGIGPLQLRSHRVAILQRIFKGFGETVGSRDVREVISSFVQRVQVVVEVIQKVLFLFLFFLLDEARQAGRVVHLVFADKIAASHPSRMLRRPLLHNHALLGVLRLA
jgi:hypothetical protein